MQTGGQFAHAHDAELQIVHTRWRGVDNEGGLANTKNRELPDLPGAEGEVLHLLFVVEHDPEGLDVVRLLNRLDNGGHIREIRISVHRRTPVLRSRSGGYPRRPDTA